MLRSSCWIGRLCAAVALVWGATEAGAGTWPQFRGPNASGRAVGEAALPSEIGPEKNVVWKTAVPGGHGSPVVTEDRIYLTAEKDKRLLTIGLERATGKVLWEVETPYEKAEVIHRIGSLAQASPASDGERVYSFFGSAGLVCHDRDGKLLWKRPMGPFNNDFGAANSPLLVDNFVILCQDHDTGSFLEAFDKKTGETVWRTDRSEFPRNYCNPVVWTSQGKKQLVIAATLRVVGYDLATGREAWTVRGVSRTVCMTPNVGENGLLYVAGWSAGGDAGELIRLPPWQNEVNQIDKNGNGTFELDELPSGDVRQRFSQFDRDKSGGITQAEYEYFRGLFEKSRNVVLAIKPNPVGEATSTHVQWETQKFVPFCSSPLHYAGLVFTVKDGGIATCLDGQQGTPHKTARLPGTGDYYASPVAGDGKVYFVNEDGKLTVVDAKPQWQVLSTADFKEIVMATPALVDGRIYLRTAGQLYCFGLSQ